MSCFLDLDGVLTDFVGGVLAYFDVKDFVVDHWNFDKTLSAKLGLSLDDFWSHFDQSFWESLAWTADGRQILAACEECFGEEVYLLTSPCRTEGCAEGKMNWVKRHLSHYQRKLFIGSSKQAFAAPGKLLVDDSDANIAKFAAAGGQTLLVPRPWNALRDLQQQTVSYIREKLPCATKSNPCPRR